jgi:hypothetical protein
MDRFICEPEAPMAAQPTPTEIDSTPAVRALRELPRSERLDALESLVAAEFKVVLLMSDDEELPLGTSYFELGFTSLRITEAKQRLERLLGRPISSSLLFNSPTVKQLLDHLTTEVFPELFTQPVATALPVAAAPAAASVPASAPASAPAPTAEQELWESALKDLYEG